MIVDMSQKNNFQRCQRNNIDEEVTILHKKSTMSNFKICDKDILLRQVEEHKGCLLLPFGGHLLMCINNHWRIEDFGLNDNGTVKTVEFSYDVYSHGRPTKVHMMFPTELVWVYNHDAIIDALKRKRVARARWHQKYCEKIYQSIEVFKGSLEYRIEQYEIH